MDSTSETTNESGSEQHEHRQRARPLKHGDDDISPPRGQAFPIIGVGASAGGLEAFKQLLEALPADTGMAFVLVQHLDPHYQSQLTDLLAPATSMPVRTVTDGMHVEENKVYVIPENSTMVLEDGRLRLVRRKPGPHFPVDAFFESLAEVQGSRAIGIVLSGNASDGSRGIRAIKGECGLTFAQDEASARHSGMPGNAINTGAVDYVLSPVAIARELTTLSRHPYLVPPERVYTEEVLPSGDGELKRVFKILRTATNVDFSHYKQNTIRRRIGRRMIVRKAEGLAEYVKLLSEYPSEVIELYRDLLISVTNFFRDPETFTALADSLKQRLPKRAAMTEAFRIWVPGCATGEEVYSLAICLNEVLEELRLSASTQLFGTDISELALSRARTAIYPEAITEDVSPERLRRYFTRMDGSYQINKALRENCVFARQDVTKDPPFGHTDLISCRNVLIYMDTALQKRVLPIFHYSLNPDGLLLLGTAETAGAAGDLFGEVDTPHRIYERKSAPFRLTLDLGGGRGPLAEAEPVPKIALPLGPLELQKRTDRILQANYGPPAVVVDADLQILHFRGHTSDYLDPSPGQASLSVLRMAREGLVLPLRRMLEAASQQNVPVRETDIRVESGGEERLINIEVTPISGNSAAERYYLVVFEEAAARPLPNPAKADLVADSAPAHTEGLQLLVRALERQLAETREYVRGLTEDHEAKEEELRAANEEVRSSNEELQSMNEELNTAKEEVQSANEELTTVNEELQNRNRELNGVNNDLSNLLSAVSVAIVMADSKLRVRRFNSAAEKLFQLKGIDGRPVGHLRGSIELPQLEQIVRQSLDHLSVEQHEIQDQNGRWYSLAVRPYRTVDDHIDGAVITFIDIDLLKKGLAVEEEARNYAEAMIETVREPLVVLDADLRVLRATSSFNDTFQVSRQETLGRLIYDLGNGQWNRPRIRELLGEALFNNKPFQEYEIDHAFPHIGRRTFRLNARRIPDRAGERPSVLLAFEDVTERREQAEARYRRLFETAKDGIVVVDAESGRVSDVNPYVLELTGYSREDFINRELSDTPAFPGGLGARFLEAAKQKEMVRVDNLPLITKYGGQVDLESVGNRYTVGGQEVIQINLRDVTDRKHAATALQESEERFRLFVTSVHDYALLQMDLSGRITTWNPGAERLLGFTEDEILGEPVQRLYTPEDRIRGEADKELETARQTGKAEDERWHLRKDGSRFFASGMLAAVRDDSGRLRGFAKIMRDITERRAADEQIRASLQEKEVLLKEIHHRVKNNLQMISSLLRLQAEFVSDPQIVGPFEEMHSRVRSIATIHEMLYADHDFGSVDFGAYSQKLTRDLFLLYSVDRNKIGLQIDIQDAYLDIGQAIPLGLIVNELLTNSLKYAFRDGRAGLIYVSLESSDGHGVLLVGDNGVGFPAELNPHQTSTMGLQLVTLLVEQLNGRLELDRGQGTRFSISFPLKAV